MRAFRLWLSNLVAPKGVAIDLARETDYFGPHALKPKAPTNLWLNRRQAMLTQGYDPRDTANP